MIEEKRLFNPNASDDNIRVLGGETTNLLNLENIKYGWAHDIFDQIFANNWLPHKAPMGSDKQGFKQLTHYEQKAYKDIISFLVFLDSIQTNNLPNIASYITAPDIVYVLARQTYDEAIHSKSYGWILSSLFNHNEANEIVYAWRDNPILLERNKFIAEIYQTFVDEPTSFNLLSAIVANYLLEGLYFYNGFQFFHNLAARGLMVGTDTQIRYIQRDELQHCAIFQNILIEIKKENPELFDSFRPRLEELFKQAVEWEIKFSQNILGNNILGITNKSIEEYSYYLGNLRLRNIKEPALFPKIPKNPYRHLELIAGVEDESSNRSNNFEVTSINYKTITAISGFDDI